MDIKDIEAVVAVCDTGSYFEAAFHLSLSHAALSRRIVHLENELGVTIFTRAKKSSAVTLTRSGDKLISYFREILSCSDKIINLCSELDSAEHAALRVGYAPCLGTFGEKELFSSFALTYPSCSLRRTLCYEDELIQKLTAGQLDCIILSVQASAQQALYKHLPLGRYQWIPLNEISQMHIGVGTRHPLAVKKEIVPSDFPLLAKETFIVDTTTVEKSQFTLNNIFRLKHIKRRIVDFTEPKTALSIVRAGGGVLPQSSRIIEQDGIVFIPVKASVEPVKTSLVYKTGDETPALKLFVKFARQNSDAEQPLSQPDF